MKSAKIIYSFLFVTLAVTLASGKNLSGVENLSAGLASVFSTNSGIGLEYFLPDEDTTVRDWEKTSIDQNLYKDSFNLTAFLNLNKEAAHVWDELMDCYSEISDKEQRVQKIRNDYLAKSIECKAGHHDVIKHLEQLHGNFEDWVDYWLQKDVAMLKRLNNMSQKPESVSNLLTDSLPPLHPLLGQVIMEYIAKLLVKVYSNLYLIYQETVNRHIQLYQMEQYFSLGEHGFENAMINLSEREFGQYIKCSPFPDKSWNSTEKVCEEMVSQLFIYRKLKFLISSNSHMYCQNFGFWPNATIYLYSYRSSYTEWDPPFDGQQIEGHPAFLNQSVSIKNYTFNQHAFSFRFKDGGFCRGNYFILKDKDGTNKVDMANLDSGKSSSPSLFKYDFAKQCAETAYYIHPVNDDYSFERAKEIYPSLQGLQCWGGADGVLKDIKSIYRDDKPLPFHKFYRIYESLYDYYFGNKNHRQKLVDDASIHAVTPLQSEGGVTGLEWLDAN